MCTSPPTGAISRCIGMGVSHSPRALAISASRMRSMMSRYTRVSRIRGRSRVSRAAILPQPPEVARQSQARKQRLRLLERWPPPVGPHLAAIPSLRQFPALRDRQGGPPRLRPLRAPAADVFFAPEEQHGFSGEDDVIPPPARRQGKVDDAASL